MRLILRDDAPPNLVELAVGRCLIDVMDISRWTELGLITDTAQMINNHPRLLRSLRFNDEDYDACVYGIVPSLLGKLPERQPTLYDPAPAPPPPALRQRYTQVDIVVDYIDLPVWLGRHDEAMLKRLFKVDAMDATLPDGTVLSAAEAAAARLEVGEMRRQVDRIRRDHGDDPEAAVGQAKELLETTCKTILGMTGDREPEDIPKLVARTMTHLGIDPSQVGAAGGDEVAARAGKRILGGLSSILNGAAELRNKRGTGHGRSGAPALDDALARLTVGLVLPAVVYLIETYEARIRPDQAPELVSSPHEMTYPHIAPGVVVTHEALGEGQVTAVEGTGDQMVVTVDFTDDVGRKRLLVRYAPITVLD